MALMIDIIITHYKFVYYQQSCQFVWFVLCIYKDLGDICIRRKFLLSGLVKNWHTQAWHMRKALAEGLNGSQQIRHS